jgi:hypothetical protein
MIPRIESERLPDYAWNDISDVISGVAVLGYDSKATLSNYSAASPHLTPNSSSTNQRADSFFVIWGQSGGEEYERHCFCVA